MLKVCVWMYCIKKGTATQQTKQLICFDLDWILYTKWESERVCVYVWYIDAVCVVLSKYVLGEWCVFFLNLNWHMEIFGWFIKWFCVAQLNELVFVNHSEKFGMPVKCWRQKNSLRRSTSETYAQVFFTLKTNLKLTDSMEKTEHIREFIVRCAEKLCCHWNCQAVGKWQKLIWPWVRQWEDVLLFELSTLLRSDYYFMK